MGDLLLLAGAFASGAALGAMFFGGLWWTVTRGLASPHPALWFLGSKLLRTTLALGGFYLVGGVRWERWALCMIGFLFARLFVSRITRSPALGLLEQAPEARRAP